MRTGFIVSAVVHLALIGWGVVSLRAFEPLDASDFEAVPIELIDLSEVSSVPVGLKSAEEQGEPSPNDPSEIVADEPAPAPEPPKEKPTPPPPPPPPPEPLPEPEPVVEEKPPVEAVPVEQKEQPAEAEAMAEPEPKPEETAEPPPEPEPAVQQAAVEPPTPRSRPPTPPTPPTESRELTDEITALLDKTKTAAAPAPSTQPATIGAVTGSPFSKLQQNEIDALRARLAACWNIPPTRADPVELRVKIKMFLSVDGALTQVPEVVEYRPTQVGQIAAESAIRAVRQCAPYDLPVEKYDSWREIIVTFDPREMFGG